MLQTTERPAAPGRRGLLRRFLVRGERHPSSEERDPIGTVLGPPTLIDLRDDLPAVQWRMAVSERLERLETGMALVADTMKRAFAQVYRSIEDLQGASGKGGELQQILDESITSLKASVEELAEAIHRVPYILAAAADDINAQLEAAHLDADRDAGLGSPAPPARDPRAQPDLLPATPFDLEPVEDQFPPMDEDSDEFEARKIWRLEA
jgi:hypothetical protein